MTRLLYAFALSLSLAAGLWGGRAFVRAQEAPQPPAAEPAPVEPAPAEAQVEADIETSPTELGHTEQPRAMRSCSTQDVLNGVCTAEEAAQASGQRPWRLMGRIEFLSPVIYDDTPETELRVYYYAGGELDLPWVRGLYALAWVGLSQRFWRIEGESPVDFIDPLIGLGYRHSIDLGARDLTLVHRFGAWLPASRPSRANLYYTTLDWVTAARYPFQLRDVGKFVVGVNIWSQLAFQKYETQSGESITGDFATPGGANTLFRLEGAGLLQYTIFDFPSAGDLVAEAGVGYRYRARLDGSYEPDWYWSLGATYTPIRYFSVGLSLEHGAGAYSDIMRGGVTHFVAFDRDETMWQLTLYGRY